MLYIKSKTIMLGTTSEALFHMLGVVCLNLYALIVSKNSVVSKTTTAPGEPTFHSPK